MVSSTVQRALRAARILYLTTYSAKGKAGTVPIWFFVHHEHIYFCTQRDSLKVRRMRRRHHVTLHIGRRTGPRLTCTAHLLEDTAALQALLLRTYRTRYWFAWLFLGPRLRRAFARGEEIIVQLTPCAMD